MKPLKELKFDTEILFINQTLNLLQQIYDNEQYIGFQIEQSPWTSTLGYDYTFICPNTNIVVKITDNFIHILRNNEKIYEIPTSGNYVAIQEKCERLMSISDITDIKKHTLTDNTTVLITKKFKKR